MNSITEKNDRDALIKRINRKLDLQNQKLVCARRESELGWYYVVDVHTGNIEARHVDVEELGRKLGVFDMAPRVQREIKIVNRAVTRAHRHYVVAGVPPRARSRAEDGCVMSPDEIKALAEAVKALLPLSAAEEKAKKQREFDEFCQEMAAVSRVKEAERAEEAKRNPPPAPPAPRTEAGPLGPPCPFVLLPSASLTADQRFSLMYWDHPGLRDRARALAEPVVPPGELSSAAIEDIARFCSEALVHDEYATLHVSGVIALYRQSPGAKPTKGASDTAFAAAFVTGGLVPDARSRYFFHAREADDGLNFASGDAVDVQPTQWIVPGLIPTGCQMVFVADEGAMKTTTAASLAAAVAHGGDWLDRPTARAQAAFINFDGRDSDLRQLLHDAGARGKVNIASYPDCDLNSDRLWGALEKRFGNGSPALIVVDSLSRGSRDVDEKDARFAAPVLRAAEISSRYPITFLWLHHCPKNVKGDSLNDWLRGTSALAPAFDIGFTFTVVSKKTTAPRETIVRVQCPRMRPKGVIPPAPFKLRMTDAGLALHNEARRKAPLTVDEKVLAAVAATPGISSTGILDTVDGRDGLIIKARERLESDGLIENRGSANKPKWFAL